jgi:hypothetical protein
MFCHQTGVAEVLNLNQKGLDQAEQLCRLSVHMYSCLYSTVQLTGASLASEEVSLTLVNEFVKKFVNE